MRYFAITPYSVQVGIPLHTKETVNTLAIRSGVTPSTVYSMLNDKSQNHGVVSIKKLCNRLSISVREFFDCDLFDSTEQEIQ